MEWARSTARRRTWRGSPSYGVRSGVITSQNMRPTPCSSGRQGSTANVPGSGIAIMSDSSIALKPVIEDPSKPMPASNASSSSAALIEKDFSWPRMSVNQKRMKRMLRSSTSALTSSAVFGRSGPIAADHTQALIAPPSTAGQTRRSVAGDGGDELRYVFGFLALVEHRGHLAQPARAAFLDRVQHERLAPGGRGDVVAHTHVEVGPGASDGLRRFERVTDRAGVREQVAAGLLFGVEVHAADPDAGLARAVGGDHDRGHGEAERDQHDDSERDEDLPALGARQALHTRSKGGQIFVTLGIVVLIAFGLAVPAVVIAANGSSKASVGVGGVHLNAEEQTGRDLFAHACAVCHTLEATKSVGRTGPNLDVRVGDDIATSAGRKALVLNAIEEGRARGLGQMPAMLYQGKEAEDVAKFVAAVAGH